MHSFSSVMLTLCFDYNPFRFVLPFFLCMVFPFPFSSLLPFPLYGLSLPLFFPPSKMSSDKDPFAIDSIRMCTRMRMPSAGIPSVLEAASLTPSLVPTSNQSVSVPHPQQAASGPKTLTAGDGGGVSIKLPSSASATAGSGDQSDSAPAAAAGAALASTAASSSKSSSSCSDASAASQQ